LKRIFLSLAILSVLCLIGAFALGLAIGDPASRDAATQQLVGWHINAAMLALVFCALVHALVLTYFMGTGRWMDETSAAYRLSEQFLGENRRLKQRTIPAMAGCLLLLVVTGALGSLADPAAGGRFETFLGMSAATIHFAVASAAVTANVFVNLWEYLAIHRNGELVEQVLAEVRRIRTEKGLPV
jgi:hypothetical protein